MALLQYIRCFGLSHLTLSLTIDIDIYTFTTFLIQDHTYGVYDLYRHYKCEVVGPVQHSKHIPYFSYGVSEQDTLNIAGLQIQACGTPGRLREFFEFFPYLRTSLSFLR